jgi:integrase
MGVNITREDKNRWLLDVRVRKNGKEIRKRETFIGTRAKAGERFFELKREVRDGRSADSSISSPATFGDVLDLYADVRGPIPPKEIGRFNRLKGDLGGVSIPELPWRLESYLKLLRQRPTEKTRRLPSNGSINKLLILTKAAFNLAVDRELLEKSPISNARFPRLKEIPRDKVLTPEEEARLFQVITNEAPHLAAIVRFAILVPCRKSELVRMRREDLDLFNRTIRVRNGTTKNDEGCWKPIPPSMVAYFRSIPPECPWLFYRVEKGAFLPLGDFKKAWATCKRLAGITDFRFHDTRHISATNLVVMAVAGWKTNMLRTYYHRSGKRSLALVRSSPGSGHPVDTFGREGAQKAAFPSENCAFRMRDSA